MDNFTLDDGMSSTTDDGHNAIDAMAHHAHDLPELDFSDSVDTLSTNSFSAGMDGGIPDVPEGNVEELLAYPDPLAQAALFQPDPFGLTDMAITSDGFSVDPSTVDSTIAGTDVDYAMAQDGGLMPSWSNVDEMDGVNNGMLSDDSQLDSVIAAGEVQGTEHISEEDIVRSEDAKEQFLHEHGYTEVPAGYEVHHIVPLSQGGADDPNNMILLTEAQHDAVTAAHRKYYGW